MPCKRIKKVNGKYAVIYKRHGPYSGYVANIVKKPRKLRKRKGKGKSSCKRRKSTNIFGLVW